MRKLVAEIFDPATHYEVPLPTDIARALELDAKFEVSVWGWSMGGWRQ